MGSTQNDASASNKRVIKVLPDSGSLIKLTAEDGLTVGQLMALLKEKGHTFSLDKNLLTQKGTLATFLVAEAQLPDGDIVLFSTVKDPKGNDRSRAEIMGDVKAKIIQYGDKAKAHFTVGTRNYTQISSADLEKLLKSFRVGSPKAATPVATKTVAKAAPVVAAPKAQAPTKVATKVAAPISADAKEEAELRATAQTFGGILYKRR